MPRGCHEASAALKGGGRALGGRRRDQTHRHLRRRHTRHHPLHAWGAAPGMCRAVLALEPPRDPGGQPHTDGLPPRRAASRQAVTGPVGEPPRHQPFLTRWAEDADGGQRGRWRHSVLDRRDEGATRAPTRAGAPLCWWLEHPGSDVRRRPPLQRPDGSCALRRSACPLRGWGGADCGPPAAEKSHGHGVGRGWAARSGARQRETREARSLDGGLPRRSSGSTGGWGGTAGPLDWGDRRGRGERSAGLAEALPRAGDRVLPRHRGQQPPVQRVRPLAHGPPAPPACAFRALLAPGSQCSAGAGHP
jgi:hypothetical protein